MLLSLPLILFGQRSNTVFSTSANGLIQWTYQDFVENKVVRIQAFEYEIKKNDKVKKDSTKLFDQKLLKDSNLITGINCYLSVQTDGPIFLTWYKFKDYYNPKGNLIKHLDQLTEVVKIKEFGSVKWEVNINETDYQYDERDLLIKKAYNRIEHSYSIFNITKDTFHLHKLKPKFYEYQYNNQGLEIKSFYTDDSTRYLATKNYTPDSSSIKCIYCDPRYMNTEKEYDSLGNLLKWTSFTRKNEVHTKHYYFYNEKNQVVKQIDSTGWYLQNNSEDYPYLESIKLFEYRNDKLSKKTERKGRQTYISEYDDRGNLISHCRLIPIETDECDNYEYVYKNELMKEIHILPNQKTLFEYDKEGLIIEKKEYLNDKLTSVIKYFHEKEN